MQQDKASLTVYDHSRCSAFPLGHDVFGDTGVIGCVRKPGLLDDQVVINGDVKISVFHGIYHLFVLQPLHLGVSKGGRGGSESAHSHTTTSTVPVIFMLIIPESSMSQVTLWRTHLLHAARNKTPWQQHGRAALTHAFPFRPSSLPPSHPILAVPCLQNISACSECRAAG